MTVMEALMESHLSPNPAVCWLIGAGAALFFGLTAQQARRGRLLWVIGGGLVGLVICTVVLGVEHAAALPISELAYRNHSLAALFVALALIGGVWWISTRRLRPHSHPASGRSEPH